MKNDLEKKDKLLIIIYWSIVLVVLCVESVPKMESLVESLLFALLMVLSLSIPLTYLIRRILEHTLRKRSYKAIVLMFPVCCLIVAVIFVALVYTFYMLEKIGVFTPSSYFEFADSFSDAISTGIKLGMSLNLTTFGFCFILEYFRSEKIILQYQLRLLRHQVTPHFMFNVLNHINVLMQTDVELASSLLIKYSEILRYQLYNGDKEKVTLEQDIQFLQNFIAVEDIRWGDKVTLNCSWQIEDGKKEIPALLFITFIENAFKHVSKSNFEKGYITIDFRQQGDVMKLMVENSKSAILPKENRSKGLGLKNIRERLNILYDKRHRIEIKETDLTYCVELMIGA